MMVRLSSLASSLENSGLQDFHLELLQRLEHRYAHPRHRLFDNWQNLIESLPDISPSFIDLDRAAPVIGRPADCTGEHGNLLQQSLKALCPWRKGPFRVFGIDIDAEWRSDWKWSRIAPHLGDLQDRRVLDVGCGNGYYALRMQALGARLVLGVEPMWTYVFQFFALQKYLPAPQRIFVLPLRLEELPDSLSGFDTVVSMGVLYHCRQPRAHLARVFGLLQEGGRLLLETLIIEDRGTEALVPVGRYASMRNVWVIPSLHPAESLAGRIRLCPGPTPRPVPNHCSRAAPDGLDDGAFASACFGSKGSSTDYRGVSGPLACMCRCRKTLLSLMFQKEVILPGTGVCPQQFPTFRHPSVQGSCWLGWAIFRIAARSGSGTHVVIPSDHLR